jgi:CRP-like cAMP-binding protein
VANLRKKTFERGATLLREGDQGDDFAILLSGRVKLIARAASGRSVLVGLRGPGALLGELGAIDGKPRAADVVALESGEAAVGSLAYLSRYLKERPSAMAVVTATLVERLRESDRGRVELAAHDALGRVALRLLELSDNYGRAEGSGTGVRIQVPISQDELADWTGMSRQAVARALSTLRVEGHVSTHRMGMSVHDPDRLRAML